MKVLILYVFHEYTDNVRNFINRGLVNDPNKEFIFISNGSKFDIRNDDSIISHDNAHLFIRQNIGHDFGGWNDALFLPVTALNHKVIEMEHHEDARYLYTLFDNIIFLNSTVDGPYIPNYYPYDWIDCFTSKLSYSIPMTGISANFMNDTPVNLCQLYNELYKIPYNDAVHIQSMAFSLNKTGLNILIKYKLFNSNRIFPTNKWLLICSCEIGMSSLLRYEGYSLYSFVKSQGEIKHDRLEEEDNLWTNSKMLYSPYELIFIKTIL